MLKILIENLIANDYQTWFISSLTPVPTSSILKYAFIFSLLLLDQTCLETFYTN